MSGELNSEAPASHWAGLGTEARHPLSTDLDVLPAREVTRLLLEEDQRALGCARDRSEEIAQAAEWFAQALEEGGDVVLLGAGTSGRLAVLEAAECPPTFGTEPRRVRAVIAGGEEAVFRAREGAEDRADEGRAAVDTARPGDLLIGISASSVTPFVAGALAAARERGIRTVLVTCVSPAAATSGQFLGQADLVIALDTGPEILTGSTRLKAGSATKGALNAITTAGMVRLGKVFENWMVDLRPGSAKLHDRGRRIIAAAAGVSSQEAERLWQACEGEIKTAIVVARRGVSAGEARDLLTRSAGRVRAAIALEV